MKMRIIILCLILTGCAHEYRQDFGTWQTPIQYKVLDNCPEWLHSYTPELMAYAPVKTNRVEKDANFYITCSPHPPGEIMLPSDQKVGLADPRRADGERSGYGDETVQCFAWVDPENYFYPTDHNKVLTRTVLGHEIGHCLGLGHSTYPNSLMISNKPRRPRSFSPDDVAELRKRYGL